MDADEDVSIFELGGGGVSIYSFGIVARYASHSVVPTNISLTQSIHHRRHSQEQLFWLMRLYGVNQIAQAGTSILSKPRIDSLLNRLPDPKL